MKKAGKWLIVPGAAWVALLAIYGVVGGQVVAFFGAGPGVALIVLGLGIRRRRSQELWRAGSWLIRTAFVLQWTLFALTAGILMPLLAGLGSSLQKDEYIMWSAMRLGLIYFPLVPVGIGIALGFATHLGAKRIASAADTQEDRDSQAQKVLEIYFNKDLARTQAIILVWSCFVVLLLFGFIGMGDKSSFYSTLFAITAIVVAGFYVRRLKTAPDLVYRFDRDGIFFYKYPDTNFMWSNLGEMFEARPEGEPLLYFDIRSFGLDDLYLRLRPHELSGENGTLNKFEDLKTSLENISGTKITDASNLVHRKGPGWFHLAIFAGAFAVLLGVSSFIKYAFEFGGLSSDIVIFFAFAAVMIFLDTKVEKREVEKFLATRPIPKSGLT